MPPRTQKEVGRTRWCPPTSTAPFAQPQAAAFVRGHIGRVEGKQNTIYLAGLQGASHLQEKGPPRPQKLPTHVRLNDHIQHLDPTTAEMHNQGHDAGLTHHEAWHLERKKYNGIDRKTNEQPAKTDGYLALLDVAKVFSSVP